MGVICFASLKGGVGKTTLSLNVANAFAERGCQTLLIDLDPSGHSSRFFRPQYAKHHELPESPLARLFLSGEVDRRGERLGSVVETAMALGVPMISPLRPRFALLSSGPELRHLLWGRGAQSFTLLLPRLLEELRCSYDYIIIDTPPDYNVLTRNSIAVSDLVCVPVDPSAMSIHCLEEIVKSSGHIKGPVWSICRTMVNRQASRVQTLSTDRIKENLNVCSSSELEDEDDIDELDEPDMENADSFISMLERGSYRDEPVRATNGTSAKNGASAESPIFLLNSLVYRTEQQNRLTFVGKTAFDNRQTLKLAQQYLQVAKELEEILSMAEERDSYSGVDDYLSASQGILDVMSQR